MKISSSFKSMHFGDRALFLPNAWDTLSAIILEQAGFQAIGTTSWGVSNSFGYTDGEKISFEELLAVAGKIINAVSIPVSVDIETGYADSPETVAENVLEIAKLGAAGINIEDSYKDNSGLKDSADHSGVLSLTRARLDEGGFTDFYINARIDTYFQLENPLEETINRANAYSASGATGVFVPGLHQADQIKAVVDAINVPLNLLSLPNLTDTHALEAIGVKRFSIGNALSDATIAFIEESARKLLHDETTASLYSNAKIQTRFK